VFVTRIIVRHGGLGGHRAAMSAGGRKLRQFGQSGLLVSRVIIQVKLVVIEVIRFGDGRSRIGVVQRTRSKAMRSPVFGRSSRELSRTSSMVGYD
jgi:hypothetical protein